ncbi:Carbonic anhydrase or acetyltransferase, isoleucine patch superfamily [Parasphingorhabdus marina DSM 22363]|uniref:Carbonic anhydrase or acetyltransferase, isoleucine patch superfamily n=1 Tax=Parasphingorhabdus marina DSM 22363 TaxID=1123272 RepID=A0A1N6CTX6_9SPHN|nr:gamma carbonic anhydrase family protein [Parasphingorhabdus marina]SIN61927.1 Carbonic anhydrase or acetyltransferase, isoleucine patch superfamily [Parasphingorhabdus marina DSM 22363]
MKDVTILPFNGKTPKIHNSAFIAPGCKIIGDVEIGPESSVWYNCVIRADVNFIRIGARSNIQDGTTIHCDSASPATPNGHPTIIGDDVLVGHMVMLHGAKLEDRAFVGLSTTVMDGCVIEGDAMLAAGATLTPNKRIPSGQLWAGSPAKYMRDLPEPAIAGMRMGVAHYVENAKAHKAAIEAADS